MRLSTRADMRPERAGLVITNAANFVAQSQSTSAAGLGEPDGGWHYKYPIHEVPDNQLTAYQGVLAFVLSGSDHRYPVHLRLLGGRLSVVAAPVGAVCLRDAQ